VDFVNFLHCFEEPELFHVLLGLQEYVAQLDSSTSLGLAGDSIYCLHIGDVVYSPGMYQLSWL